MIFAMPRSICPDRYAPFAMPRSITPLRCLSGGEKWS